MKKSLSLWSVHRLYEQGIINLTQFVQFAHEIGAEGVEVVSFLLKDKDKQLPELMGALEEYGLALAAYSISNDFAKSSPEERSDMLEHVKKEIDIAEMLHCNTVRVFSSDYGNGIDYEVAREWIVDGLKQVCNYAKEKNINICLENHGYFAGTCAQMEQMINDVSCDNLKVTLDIGNFILMDDNPAHAAYVLASKAALVHVKDFHLVQDSYPMKAYKANSGKKYIGAVISTGVIDVKYALEQLIKADYTGYLSLEYDGGEADTRENLKIGMEILDILLKSLNEEHPYERCV